MGTRTILINYTRTIINNQYLLSHAIYLTFLILELLLLNLLLFQDPPIFDFSVFDHNVPQFIFLLFLESFVSALIGLPRFLRPILLTLAHTLVECLEDFLPVETTDFLDEASPSNIILILRLVISP